MTVTELMDELFRWCAGCEHDYSQTCDTLKIGDPQCEVRKVGVTMFATPEVIRQAHAWGANFLIVHEPLFYNHWDREAPHDPVVAAKKKLLLDTGLTVWRYHDHPHARPMDMICEGELKYLGLKGKFMGNKYFGVNRFELAVPMTPRELARMIEVNLHVNRVRIAGNADFPATRLSLGFGTPGHDQDELRDPEVDILLSGETCEYGAAEYVRDASQLGINKAVLTIGHLTSERDGMRLLVDLMQEKMPDLPVRYFESGEFGTYTRD